jgi:FlaA1/EpsC-like NDP-sugar epimerase
MLISGQAALGRRDSRGVIDRMIDPLLALPRVVKRGIALSVDAGLCVLTVWLAYSLRVGEWVALSGDGWPAAFASVLIALPIFAAFGLYRAVFRYVSWEALTTIAQAVFIYGIIYSSVFTAFSIPGVPRTVGIIQPILLMVAMGASRAFGRFWLGGRYRQMIRRQKRNVLIYGAGSAGRQLAAALADSIDIRLVGFIDDENGLQGSTVGGVRVHPPHELSHTVERLEVEEIFLAVPSATQARRNEILEMLREVVVEVRTLPGLLDLAHGKVTVSQLRPLDIEDLLGRDAVAPDQRLLERNIRDKVVLVTGAGGSIGSELCRQIVAMHPRRLLLLELSEFALYSVHSELRAVAGEDVELVPLLASVCDEERLRRIFATWRPDTVYHAAAYKHVPLVEHNVVEGVRNNVFGTLCCARMASQFRTDAFVLISTDKAVRPTNVMGASKRLAEMVLQALAADRPDTSFSMVRFGNVLGSSGSVVPLFRQQINIGGPVTVTHPAVTRYFMTIPEAAQLVIQAGAMAQGGDVFVLDMGEPVRIYDLAVRMIELSGMKVRDHHDPDGDIEIEITGLRPGEKLYEELLIGADPAATGHPRIMVASESFLPTTVIMGRLNEMRAAIVGQDVDIVRTILMELVPEYAAADSVVDWVVQAQSDARAAMRADLAPPLAVVRSVEAGQ